MRRGAVTILAVALLSASCAEDESHSIDCADAASLSIEPVADEHIWVADYPLAGCGALTTSFLFRNTGPVPVAIEEVRADDPRFSVSSDLPRQVVPGQTFAMTLGFASSAAEAGEAVTEMTLAGSDGCYATEVKGLTVAEGGLVSQSDAAIDFGDVPIGETRTRDLVVSWQRVPNAPAPLVSGFAAGPDPFALMSAPATEFEPAPCDTRTIRVAFTAPAMVGPHEGTLFWEQESEGFFALIGVPLFGNVIRTP